MGRALTGRLHAARAAAWALRAALVARRGLRSTGVDLLELPRVPALPRAAGRGMDAILRRGTWTCLERALVRQRWLAAHGAPRDLLIGINASKPFVAHAWLEGDPTTHSAGYAELSRHRAPA